MSAFHQLWSRPGASALHTGRDEVLAAQRLGSRTSREREFIDAAAVYFSDVDPAHLATRAKDYEHAMESVARSFPKDDEAQIWWAASVNVPIEFNRHSR